ncbi:hypothetical protein CNEO3_80106 [Clostridium neonatale]|uniref:Uncharacterized protein n=1 Tax=Clostridium neonatale TaxID=137838 RepID=A0AA86MLT7_9CLOT|nr:hypothetical protein CNEO_40240 [Clostridium neonatale]CAG9712633.1 hypothetical protein CNEO_1720059 [Clostridium neonatale]CAG9713632.1 hypothetical protein CNEO_570006 [Clostridium neonatale]CAI3195185.1 hypothetical protein CNEO2_120032 [Clostridium neonatale]CAI3197189.1 hypothetical protein CNEO2_190041 [Clostridium neonatale]
MRFYIDYIDFIDRVNIDGKINHKWRQFAQR